MNINPLFQVIISAVVLFATQGVKKIQSIPINDGQKLRIRSFVGVTTFGLTLLTAWLNGDLTGVLTPDMIQVGVAGGVSWFLSHFAYKLTLNQ